MGEVHGDETARERGQRTAKEREVALAQERAARLGVPVFAGQEGRQKFAVSYDFQRAWRSKREEGRPVCPRCGQVAPPPSAVRAGWYARYSHRKPSGEPCESWTTAELVNYRQPRGEKPRTAPRKHALMLDLQRLVASGIRVDDAAAQLGVGQTNARAWLNRLRDAARDGVLLEAPEGRAAPVAAAASEPGGERERKMRAPPASPGKRHVKLTAEQRNEALQLAARGMPTAQIARRLGVHRGTMRRVVGVRGPQRGIKLPSERQEEIWQLAESGVPAEEIAERGLARLGVVYKVLRARGRVRRRPSMSKEQRVAAHEMRNAGSTHEQLARHFAVPVPFIRDMFPMPLGGQRKLTQAQRNEALQRYRWGERMADLALEMKVDKGTIRNAIQEATAAGKQEREERKRASEQGRVERERAIHELRAQGLSLHTIGRIVGITRRAVQVFLASNAEQSRPRGAAA